MKLKTISIPGILFLVGYEALFLFLLFLCISCLFDNHEAWLNYKRDTSPGDYNGYLDYQVATFWTCLCSMMVAWPPTIMVVAWCCGDCGDNNNNDPNALRTVLLEPSAPCLEEALVVPRENV
jgi:hypothetical protein